MRDGGEPTDNDVLDPLLVQDGADPNGIKHQRACRRSDAFAVRWIESITLAASTMVRTRSGTDKRNCRRIWEMSTPRSSSINGNSSTPSVYDGPLACARSAATQIRHSSATEALDARRSQQSAPQHPVAQRRHDL